MATSFLYHRVRAAFQIWLMQSLIPITFTYFIIETIRSIFQKTFRETVSPLPLLKTSASCSGFSLNSDDIRSDEDSISVQSEEETKQNRSETSFTIVLTGGKMSKTLHICRCLRSYANNNPGTIRMKIVVLEQSKFKYNATRSSICIDAFETITSPRESAISYMNDIVKACHKHNATHFLPIAAPVEAVYDSKLKEILENEVGTKSLHMNHELCVILDDKHKFGCFLRDTLKVKSLRTYLVNSNDEVHKLNRCFNEEKKNNQLNRNMILKNLSYDPIHRLDLFQLPCSEEELSQYLSKVKNDGNPITPDEPWQLQEFLRDGIEYTAMIVVRDNNLLALTCAASSASQLNYVHVEIPAIRSWVEAFMTSLQQQDSKYSLTGQLCFDFMVVVEDGGKQVAYPIECNPRVHTQCTVYHSEESRALFGQLLLANGTASVTKDLLIEQMERDFPLVTKIPTETYWFYNEFFKIFPDGWLLKYNEKNDAGARALLWKESLTPTMTTDQVLVLIFYMPSIVLSIILAMPILAGLALMYFMSLFNSENRDYEMSTRGHAKVILLKFLAFVQRRLVDSPQNLEVDNIMGYQDPLPFFIKNHVQVVSRLFATFLSGVEWKKIDFAIGKVVEVGGD